MIEVMQDKPADSAQQRAAPPERSRVAASATQRDERSRPEIRTRDAPSAR
jgi:hypothetical protein